MANETVVTDSKVCRRCSEIRPLTEYHRDKQKRDGLRPYCKGCEKYRHQVYHLKRDAPKQQAYARDYYQRNREERMAKQKSRWQSLPIEERRERGRRYRHKALYGLTPEEYIQMLVNQDGLCAICRIPHDEILRVDHDHANGKVRGLLCDQCNKGLGLFADDTNRLEAASRYVKGDDYR